jgi:hypothetical protein
MRPSNSFRDLFSYTELATTIILTTCLFSPITSAALFSPAPQSNLDLSQLGRVAVIGDFNAASLFEFISETENVFQTNGTQALLSRYPSNGAFANLDNSDAFINALCTLTSNGSTQGIVVGGNFTSLGGVNSPGIALYNTNTSAISPISGLNGKVNALYCDPSGVVYVGGMFSVPGVNSSNAVTWSPSGFASLPFTGFDGAVTSIVKDGSGNVIFGGSFGGLSNTTSTGVGLNSQAIPLLIANATAVGSSGINKLNTPTNVICKDSGTDGPGAAWLLANNTVGNLTFSFGYGFNPTLLRITNTNFTDDGTKTWYFTAEPSGGIMNFTYFDENSVEQSCTNLCPLAHNTTAQDFHFVNTIGMTGFTVHFLDFYGNAGGISGFELFENDIFSFAVPKFNEPACPDIPFPSNSSSIGNWTTLPGSDGNPDYLSVNITGTDDPLQNSIVFSPDIKQSGNYTIMMYTPGCQADNSCATRGQVNITGTLTAGGKPFQTTLYQTNDFEKFDPIFIGLVGASSDSFKPTVTLTPIPGQTGPINVVAERVKFVLDNSSGGLNGIFEWNPSAQVVDFNFRKSTLDTSATNLDSDAVVNTLVSVGNSIFVGGRFTGTNVSNFFQIGNSTQGSTNIGLNGAVNTMYENNNAIYVGGAFNGTSGVGGPSGISGIALYNTTTNAWSPLGAGVNGIVNYIVPFQLNLTSSKLSDLALAVSGQFSQVLGFTGASTATVNNFAVWIPSRNNWLQNLNLSTVTLQGILTAATDTMSNGTFYAGSVSSFDVGASGAVEINNSGSGSLEAFPVVITPPQNFVGQSNQKLRRQVSNSTTPANSTGTASGVSSVQSGVLAGAFTESGGRNFTVLAGKFTATGTNNTAINNLVIIDGANSDQVYGLPAGIDSTSTFSSVSIVQNLLFAGGDLFGTVNGNNITSGFVVYDLDGKKFGSPQPPVLTSSLGIPITVTALELQPNTDTVWVAGDFDKAGPLPCSTLCRYDAKVGQWTSPGVGLSGSISSMVWSDANTLLIAGSLIVNGTSSLLSVYSTDTSSFSTVTTSGAPQGSIDHVTPATSNGSAAWVSGRANDGSAFLALFNNNQWDFVNGLGPNSSINAIQYLAVDKPHTSTAIMDASHALLVMGDLVITPYGHVSAAIFNGTSMVPYILTGTSDGSTGSITGLIVSNPQSFISTPAHHLRVGFIVLIALALGLGLIFLITLIGLLLAYHRRRQKGYRPAPTGSSGSDGAAMSQAMNRAPPGQLLGGLAQR